MYSSKKKKCNFKYYQTCISSRVPVKGFYVQQQIPSNLSLTDCVMSFTNWNILYIQSRTGYLENHQTVKDLHYKHVSKALLVVKAQVGEARHQTFIFLFQLGYFSCQISSSAQQTLLLSICKQTINVKTQKYNKEIGNCDDKKKKKKPS